jgi:hypothetical protein
MEFKSIEIRDCGTHISALAIRMLADTEAQWYHMHRRCGYPADGSSIMLMRLSDGVATNDPYQWVDLGAGTRTMQVAHNHIIDHFAELEDGAVVDTEYLLGETPAPKISERHLYDHHHH